MTLIRQEYRVEWPLRALVLLDGKYIGDWRAGSREPLAAIAQVPLKQGRHQLTVIFACTYARLAGSDRGRQEQVSRPPALSTPPRSSAFRLGFRGSPVDEIGPRVKFGSLQKKRRP